MTESSGSAIILTREDANGSALRLRRSAVSYAVAVADALIIVVSAIASGMAYHYFAFNYIEQPEKYLGMGLVASAGFVLLMSARGYYRSSVIVILKKQLIYIGICGFSFAAFMATVVFLIGASDAISRGTISILTAGALFGIALSRIFWARNLALATSRGLVERKKVLLVCGAGDSGQTYTQELSQHDFDIVDVVSLGSAAHAREWFSGSGRAVTQKVNEVHLVSEGLSSASLRAATAELRDLPLPVKLVLDPFTAALVGLPTSELGDRLTVQLQRAPLSLGERALKRCFDIVVAVAALIVFGPLMAFVALTIKFDSAGPVFFRQLRSGFNNKPFKIIKFRSMTVIEDGANFTQVTRNDNRITKVGRFIRSTSVDELPQFWNVLMGQMSIVGPRPHVVSQEDRYDQLIDKYAFRRHVKPGITGWAQVNGFRGETPTVTSMERRLEHDLWYLHHWSLWLDIKIVMRTFLAMFDRGSAY